MHMLGQEECNRVVKSVRLRSQARRRALSHRCNSGLNSPTP